MRTEYEAYASEAVVLAAGHSRYQRHSRCFALKEMKEQRGQRRHRPAHSCTLPAIQRPLWSPGAQNEPWLRREMAPQWWWKMAPQSSDA